MALTNVRYPVMILVQAMANTSIHLSVVRGGMAIVWFTSLAKNHGGRIARVVTQLILLQDLLFVLMGPEVKRRAEGKWVATYS